MDIKRSGSQSSEKGSAEYFTGNVRIDPLFQVSEPALSQAHTDATQQIERSVEKQKGISMNIQIKLATARSACSGAAPRSGGRRLSRHGRAPRD
jgi:hypothetical protein